MTHDQLAGALVLAVLVGGLLFYLYMRKKGGGSTSGDAPEGSDTVQEK